MTKRYIERKFNPQWRCKGRTSEKYKKKAMYNVMGTQKMTEDILTTTVCIVEVILNQRSPTSDLDDIDCYEEITSNHFLIGLSR